MFKNYIKSIWRNLFKNKLHTVLNLSGLSIGLTCFVLLVVYIRHELSFDLFQQNKDRIVRVIMEYSSGGEGQKGNFTSTKVLPAFKQNFPEVENGVRLSSYPSVVKYEDKMFTEKRVLHADSTFFNVFSFKLLSGKADVVLKAPNQVVLSISTARKYFGDKDPVGSTIKIGSSQKDYQVTGIVEDCPENSQITYDMIASFSSFGPAQTETYFNANYTTYLLLKNPAAIASLQSKIPAFMAKEITEERYGKGTKVMFELEPFDRIHLYSPYDAFVPNTNINYIYILGAISIFILLIACFTYINLSTAKSIDRAKEVGVRKVIGAGKFQVFSQFMGEAFMITVIAACISIVLATLLLKPFSTLADKAFLLSALFEWRFLLIFVLITLMITLLAGSYPAFILAKLKPVSVLKGAFKNSDSAIWLRKSLIVFQFVISVFLITATFIIKQQLDFIQSKDMGYNRDQVLLFRADSKMVEKEELWKSELKSIPNVQSVSFSYESPVEIKGGYGMSKTTSADDQGHTVNANPIDEQYINTVGLKLIAGGNISKQDVVDASKDTLSYYHFILNEAAVKTLGWTAEEAIGKKLYLGEQRPGEIKGIVKNFHFASLHTEIKPLVLFSGEWRNTLMVKIKSADTKQVIDAIGKKWKEQVNYRPFDYRFMDEDFNAMYVSEARTANVFQLFASIAIFLACLGLFGLAAYTVAQRSKEISIRKVLGASVFNISNLLSKDFLKPIIVAIVIAVPLVYYFANEWLQDFSYRITLSWWVFITAAFVSIIIAYITVSFQSTKAAISNPIKALRTE